MYKGHIMYKELTTTAVMIRFTKPGALVYFWHLKEGRLFETGRSFLY